MFDLSRFSKIRNFHDIRLEKARLRYEMLASENRLNKSLGATAQKLNPQTLFTQLTKGWTIVKGMIRLVSGGINCLSRIWRKRRCEEQEPIDRS